MPVVVARRDRFSIPFEPKKSTSVELFEGIYDSLDHSSPEVIAAKAQKKHLVIRMIIAITPLFIAEYVKNMHMLNYKHLRHIYSKQRMLLRDPNGKGTFNMLMAAWTQQRSRLSKSFLLILGWNFIQFVLNSTFCIIYLFEIQRNSEFQPDVSLDPRWIFVSRQSSTFSLLYFLSVLSIISRVLAIQLIPGTVRFSRISLTILDLALSATFIILGSVKNGKFIYVPYFLRIILAFSQLKLLLRNRKNIPLIKISNFYEKFLILLANIVTLIYLGICAFNWFENNFANTLLGTKNVLRGKLSLLDTFYFLCITITTVGYGDISPESAGGRLCVVFIIFVTIIILPGLLSDLQETLVAQNSGIGSYSRDKHAFLVVFGDFTEANIRHTLRCILYADKSEKMRVVLISRSLLTPGIRTLLMKPLFHKRATYLVGKGLDVRDMNRADVKHAAAVFILANRGATNSQIEDEQNTLRAWGLDDFSRATPLFTETLLPQTLQVLEKTCTAVACIDDLKQLFLASNCVYRGVATLIINMLTDIRTYSSHQDPWHIQYGDGTTNALHEVGLNAIFVGYTFTKISFYLYKEFQVNLVGVSKLREDSRQVLLNPGPHYKFEESDVCFIIATSARYVNAVSNLVSNVLTLDFCGI